MNPRIEIPISKTKTAMLLIAPIALLALSAFALLSPESLSAPNVNDIGKIKLLGITGGAIGLFLSLVVIKKWLSQQAGLIIDASGITDHSNASYTGLMEWQDITKIEGKKVGPLKIIILHTHNPEKYIDQAKKTSGHQLRKNLKFYGSPLLIVSSRLQTTYDELLGQVHTAFAKAKQQ